MKDERDRACSTQGGRAKFIEGCFFICGQTRGRRTLGSYVHKWGYNIKVNVKGMGWMV